MNNLIGKVIENLHMGDIATYNPKNGQIQKCRSARAQSHPEIENQVKPYKTWMVQLPSGGDAIAAPNEEVAHLWAKKCGGRFFQVREILT